jgi:hypothetical protein
MTIKDPRAFTATAADAILNEIERSGVLGKEQIHDALLREVLVYNDAANATSVEVRHEPQDLGDVVRAVKTTMSLGTRKAVEELFGDVIRVKAKASEAAQAASVEELLGVRAT